MIIEALLNAIFAVLNAACSPINIPGMPDGMSAQITGFLSDTLSSAGSLISLFIPWSQVKMVMWVLRKIPMLGIS